MARTIMANARLTAIVSANIRARRLERGMTQVVLANAIGAQQAYVSQLEKGKRDPSLETIAAIAKALSVDPHLLLAPNAFVPAEDNLAAAS